LKKQKRKQKEEVRIAQGKERSLFDSISSSSSSEGFTSEEDEQLKQVDPNKKELIKSNHRKKRAVHMELFQRKYNRMSYIEKANEFEI